MSEKTWIKKQWVLRYSSTGYTGEVGAYDGEVGEYEGEVGE